MSVLDIRQFSGLQPRFSGAHTAMQYADVAKNVDLSGGSLRAWRVPKLISPVVGNAFSCNCEFKPLLPCEQSALISSDCDYNVISGNGRARIVLCGDDQPCDVFYLGVTPPSSPLIVNGDDNLSVGRTVSSVSYTYTFVNTLCHESAPAIPSPSINLKSGTSVQLSHFALPIVEECIDRIKIYRRETGFRSGTEEVQEQSTQFFLVGEIFLIPNFNVNTLAFSDNVIARNLGNALETNYLYPPDDGLKSIQLIRSTNNVLVGYVGRDIHFSTPNLPHVWEVKNIITLPYDIIGITAGIGYTIAFTSGGIYTLIENGDCEGSGIRHIVESHFNIQFILGADGRAGVFTHDGIVFNAATGLHRIDHGGEPTPLLPDFFDERSWRRGQPETIRLGYSRQHLFIISDSNSFLWSYGTGSLTSIDDKPRFMTNTNQGELLLHDENGIFQWNAGNQLRPFEWGNEFKGTNKIHFTLRHVDQDGLNVITMNNEPVRFIDGVVFRLGRRGKKRHNAVSVRGVYDISRICFTSTLIEMGRVG